MKSIKVAAVQSTTFRQHMWTAATLIIYNNNNYVPHKYMCMCSKLQFQTLSRIVQARIGTDQEGTGFFCFHSSKLAFSCTAEVIRGQLRSC